MADPIRTGLIYNGVCYQEALSRPGEPLADFERLPIHELASVVLEEYDVLLAPPSSDGEVLRARRHQIARFLDAGGVLVACGELLTWNPALDEGATLRAVLAALDLPAPPGEGRRGLADYGMPRPDEPHPITPEALTRKLDGAVAQAGDGAPCHAYLHSYRPVDEFARVLAAARASNAAGCWVQRYGYLSDEKLAILREAWRG